MEGREDGVGRGRGRWGWEGRMGMVGRGERGGEEGWE